MGKHNPRVEKGLVHKTIIIIIIIIKRISRAPIYRTRWEHRALYNNITKSTPGMARPFGFTGGLS